MLASLASKVAAGLALALLLSGYANYHLTKKLGTAVAECEVSKQQDTNERNVVVTSLTEVALRNQVTQLEAELKLMRENSRLAEARHSTGQNTLNQFKEEVDEARKANPDLNAVADTSRLRALETSYKNRVRAERSSDVPLSPTSTGSTT